MAELNNSQATMGLPSYPRVRTPPAAGSSGPSARSRSRKS